MKELNNDKNSENKRKYSFDLLKLIGIIFIVLHHSKEIIYLQNGYMFVEMFFMISGFFLYRVIIEKNKSTFDFIKHRLKKLYLPYLLALIVLLLMFIIIEGKLNYTKWWSVILELLMLQSIGFPGKGGVNYPCWYISVLFYSSILLYFLIKKIGIKKINILTLIVIVFFYLYAMISYGTLEQWCYIANFIYFPFIRGFCDIVLGGFIYQISKKIVIKERITNIMSMICFTIIICLMFVNYKVDFILMLLFFILILMLSYSNKNIFEKIGSLKIIQFLSSIEYYIYINHAIVIYFIAFLKKKFIIYNYLYIIILFSILLIYSYTMKIIVDKLYSFTQTKYMKLKRKFNL